MTSPPPAFPASTVVLMREPTGEVLLMLRHGRHGFMANVWVFPGGRVDAGDAVDGELASPQAFVRAAIRETWEEAGILLTDPPRAADPGEARTVDAIPWGSSFSILEPFSRWVTPPTEKKRFDTLFFLTLVPELEAVADVDEVTEALWVTPAEALARHLRGGLALAPPTLVTLHALARLGSPTAAMAWASEQAGKVVAIAPALALDGGRLLVSMPAGECFPMPGEPCGRVALVDGHWELAP